MVLYRPCGLLNFKISYEGNAVSSLVREKIVILFPNSRRIFMVILLLLFPGQLVAGEFFTTTTGSEDRCAG